MAAFSFRNPLGTLSLAVGKNMDKCLSAVCEVIWHFKDYSLLDYFALSSIRFITNLGILIFLHVFNFIHYGLKSLKCNFLEPAETLETVCKSFRRLLFVVLWNCIVLHRLVNLDKSGLVFNGVPVYHTKMYNRKLVLEERGMLPMLLFRKKHQSEPSISTGGRTEEDEPAWCQWWLWPFTWPPPLQRSLPGLLTRERRPAHPLHPQRHLTHTSTQQRWVCMERIEGLYGCNGRGLQLSAATVENSWLHLSTHCSDVVYIPSVLGCGWIKSALIHMFGLRTSQLVLWLSGYETNAPRGALSSLVGLDQPWIITQMGA